MPRKRKKASADAKEVKTTVDLSHLPEVRGYDFEGRLDFSKLMESYRTTAFQATHFSIAADIINRMIKEDASIFLSCTSNIISSGLRETVKYLVKHRKIHFLVTSAGGIEEDIIKCFKPFHVGVFDIKGKILFDKGVARIGNIFVPDDRYTYFEKFTDRFFPKLYMEQKKAGRPLCTMEVIKLLGKEINNEDSILYWAYKNSIPVICPAIMDGSFGDLLHYFKNSHPDIAIDVTEDLQRIIKHAENAGKSAIIAVGGGVPKHYALNANIFRDGVDYAVYITTAQFYDGSDSGGNTEEAVTWAKIKPDASRITIHGEATLVFPLLVAETFAKNKNRKQKK